MQKSQPKADPPRAEKCKMINQKSKITNGNNFIFYSSIFNIMSSFYSGEWKESSSPIDRLKKLK